MTQGSTHRACRWEDIRQLRALNVRTALAHPSRGGMHIGEFYWALRTSGGDPLADMRVWAADGGGLMAAAWLDGPAVGDFIIDPQAPVYIEHAMDWLELAANAAQAPALSIVARDDDGARLDALPRRGYAPTASGNVRYARDLSDEIVPPSLPDGFSLRHVDSDDEIAARAAVESAAFGGNVTANDWQLLRERLTRYQPALDLIVLAPDGRGASACTCWYDATTRTGEVEAVGTVEEFRRMGLCRVVILEGLRRLRALGATTAELYTAIGNVASAALYASCGFIVTGTDYAWSKPLG